VDLLAGPIPSRPALGYRLLHQRYAIAHTTIQTESAPPLLQVETPPL
jgi:hypothetical protein